MKRKILPALGIYNGSIYGNVDRLYGDKLDEESQNSWIIKNPLTSFIFIEKG